MTYYLFNEELSFFYCFHESVKIINLCIDVIIEYVV